MNKIDEDLKNHICKTCENLSYYDGYFCKLRLHSTKLGFLNMKKLTTCKNYAKRLGSNYDFCKGLPCTFWCNKCELYQKNKQKN